MYGVLSKRLTGTKARFSRARALGNAEEPTLRTHHIGGRAKFFIASRSELGRPRTSSLRFLLVPHPTAGVPACKMMMKKTCLSLLAIARKRSRLLVMITAHHGTANGVQWGHLRAPAVESHHSSGRLPPSCLEAVVARGTVESSSSAPSKAEWVLLAGH